MLKVSIRTLFSGLRDGRQHDELLGGRACSYPMACTSTLQIPASRPSSASRA